MMSIEKGKGVGYEVPEKDTPTIVAQTALEGGHDTALYAQGKLAKENGEPAEANPIDPAFPPQFDSWAAGWAAGTAPELAPLEAEEDAQTTDRSKLARTAKKE
jgi:hypothetical protein